MAGEKLRNFSFILEGKLAGSAHPVFAAEDEGQIVDLLRQAGIGAVVSLDERGLNGLILRDSGIEHLHLPVPDFHSPSPEQIERFAAFVDAQTKAGRAVLAHCHAGVGRTGTMLACYLVSQGANPRDAISQVRAKRPGSVETYAQEDAIYAYYRSLPARENPPPSDAEPGGAASGETDKTP
jgi:atypical dual specificity phosphatase